MFAESLPSIPCKLPKITLSLKFFNCFDQDKVIPTSDGVILRQKEGVHTKLKWPSFLQVGMYHLEMPLSSNHSFKV